MTEQPTLKKVFVFLDTDKYCSPFDMLVAIDTFPDSMIFKLENAAATAQLAPRSKSDVTMTARELGAGQFLKVQQLL